MHICSLDSVHSLDAVASSFTPSHSLSFTQLRLWQVLFFTLKMYNKTKSCSTGSEFTPLGHKFYLIKTPRHISVFHCGWTGQRLKKKRKNRKQKRNVLTRDQTHNHNSLDTVPPGQNYTRTSQLFPMEGSET